MGFLTASQDRLRAYILACVGNYNDASDILQKTNVVLLRKSKDFADSGEFEAWAFSTAKYEVLSHVRDRQRDRLAFSPELVEVMVEAAAAQVGNLAARQAALSGCLSKLSADKRRLIRMRYAEDLSITQVASGVGKSTGAVKAMMRRLRGMLHECVKKRLSEPDPSGV
ncbi:ECF RNA polymerase sigma factor SigE [Pseudobythopirellula maris]|uniref:ECF RNA polymerase sigma factor SigE n=1 Tax=Pseudobythopirellula maris TaxID=2527991 RepID=A0A5C5ZK45_9BACT|nr:sigma-70 family RNA polymerase sigma factor [Pseudobythopirellula maris]TWT87495.1 ECF RNA polymerase sigma factor SigE [Pseudobythopirellula maris]